MDLSDFSNANWPIRLRFSTPPGQICIRYDGKDALELYGNCKRAAAFAKCYASSLSMG